MFISQPHDAYELIDSGNGLKLERFGKYTLIRPEVTAIWKPAMPIKKWEQLAHAQFVPTSRTAGKWQRLQSMPDQWVVAFPLPEGSANLVFSLQLTGFKHVGIFPEQSENWDFIYKQCSQRKEPEILNLFAYTGGASLAACAAGARVTHVDSIRQVVSWSNENMQLSNLDGIRWMVEDALKFARRALKRGTQYDGIVMDPPAWGLGPKGEKWKLEEMIVDLFEVTGKLVRENGFLVVNTYSGIVPTTIENLITAYYPLANMESGELVLGSRKGPRLSTGSLARAWGNRTEGGM
ncbi:MAG: class I SAM-dependent methyltransferase [Flavobacteriales bacterium]|nr:class I SAM-dependent methyltransferase [Flavobacteriales bacterium]